MNAIFLDKRNDSKGYLHEKELFILMCLLKRQRISTSWGNIFVPSYSAELRIVEGEDNPVENIESRLTETYSKLNTKTQSPIVLDYLIGLGEALDPEGFSVHCNADYALVEGGFLHDEDTNKEVSDYQEAILNKKADKDFIRLVRKLITERAGGHWDAKDAREFIKIYRRHNREQFQKSRLLNKKSFPHYDCQTMLAKLIFENVDISLSIKTTRILKDYLNNYIKLYKANKLDRISKNGLTGSFLSNELATPLHTKFFGFARQKEILLKHIDDTYKEYRRVDLEIGHPHIEPEYVGDTKSDTVKVTLERLEKHKELFLFVHTMKALGQDKYFNIIDFSFGTTGIFDLYDRGFLFQVILNPKHFQNENTSDEKVTFFDEDRSVLHHKGAEIDVRKFSDQYHTLRIIFRKPNEEWFFTEISKEFDLSADHPEKKFYNAIHQVTLKLRAKGVLDLFKTTRQSVIINKKYLS